MLSKFKRILEFYLIDPLKKTLNFGALLALSVKAGKRKRIPLFFPLLFQPFIVPNKAIFRRNPHARSTETPCQELGHQIYPRGHGLWPYFLFRICRTSKTPRGGRRADQSRRCG